MSDAAPPPTPPTPSRIEKRRPPSDAQKAALERGRAKLEANRSAKLEAKASRTMTIEEDPVEAVEPVEVTSRRAKAVAKPRRTQRVIVEESDSEDEPDIVVVRRKKPAAKKKIVYQSDSESDNEPEAEAPRRRASAPAPKPAKAPAAPRRVAPPEPEFRIQFF